MQSRREGGALRSLVLVLLVLGGLGAWNYQRNRAVEEEVFRPYRSYSDADLEQLLEAYRAEREHLSTRYESLRKQRSDTRAGPLLGERVQAFERARRAGERVRQVGATLSEHEAALRDFEAEQSLRAAERQRVRRFLKLLLKPSF